MKRLGLFSLLLKWEASASRTALGIKSAGIHRDTWVERGFVRVNCLAKEHNTTSPARSRTRSARSGAERNNHEVTIAHTRGDGGKLNQAIYFPAIKRPAL